MIPRFTAPRKRRAKPRRVAVARDRSYLDFLKSEGRCGICQVHGLKMSETAIRYGLYKIIDPAHGPVNGMSSKGPDNEAIPLCRAHHDEQTRLTWPNFELKYAFDRKRESEIWNSLYLLWKENKSWPPATN